MEKKKKRETIKGAEISRPIQRRPAWVCETTRRERTREKKEKERERHERVETRQPSERGTPPPGPAEPMSSGPGCSRVGPYLNPPFTSTPRGSRTPPSFQPSASSTASPRRRVRACHRGVPSCPRVDVRAVPLSKHAATFLRSRHLGCPHPYSFGQLVSKLSWRPALRGYRPRRHNGHSDTASDLVA